jgi:hypothetical protein
MNGVSKPRPRFASRTPSKRWDMHIQLRVRKHVRLNDVLLQLHPSLPTLRSSLHRLVQMVHRYYGAVRLLQHVHVRITVYGLHRAAGTPRAGVGKVADQPTITGSRCVQSLRSVSSDSLSFRGPGLFSDLHKCQVCDLNGSSPRVWSERTRCALSGSVPITSYVAIFSS